MVGIICARVIEVVSMYLYKSLFSINKLNQNLVSFACYHCGAREGSQRYGFVSFTKGFVFPQVSMSSKVRLSHLYIV